MKIYLSPSKQPYNKYVYGNTNEQEQMEQLAVYVKQTLENYKDVEVKIATSSKILQDRVPEALSWGADLYIALHSNAGASTAKGAVAFYHQDSKQSKHIADYIVEKLNSITPHGSNRWKQVYNGVWNAEGFNLFEVRKPFEYDITPVLIEVDFHDNPVTAKYIVENKPTIGRAIAEGIAWANNLELKEPEPVKTFYRVQVGAFIYESNAKKLRDELVEKGYKDAFIIKVGD
jgi:N-acetylmuramoyl-L-alanine amidase